LQHSTLSLNPPSLSMNRTATPSDEGVRLIFCCPSSTVQIICEPVGQHGYKCAIPPTQRLPSYLIGTCILSYTQSYARRYTANLYSVSGLLKVHTYLNILIDRAINYSANRYTVTDWECIPVHNYWPGIPW